MSKLVQGKNDLLTWSLANNPTLVDEFSNENDMKMNCYSVSSSKKILWKCKLDHTYLATISNRTKNNTGCPICTGRVALKGFNDLQTFFPDIANEWNYEKNGELTPDNVTHHSQKRVWWKCNKGHEWQTIIGSRTNQNSKCPYCSGNYAVKGETDLASQFPDITKEWNYEKNTILPDEISQFSSKRVYWTCKVGHTWKTQISNRTLQHTGCPICAKESHTSFPEQAIYYYLSLYFKDIINSYNDLGFELDIYLPSIRTAVEYDGLRWHKDKKINDLKKNQLCINNDIKLIRIREFGLESLDNCLCLIRYDNRTSKSLNKVLIELLENLNISVHDIDIKKDTIKILETYKTNVANNSLFEISPIIAKEWNYEKNGILLPSMFSYGSKKIVWWKCNNEHEYQMSMNERTNRNSGCPYCSGRRILKGFNDLATLKPEFAKEWDFEKNGNLSPSDVTLFCKKKVWWICDKGHNYQAVIASRCTQNSGCFKCKNIKQSKKIINLDTSEIFDSIKEAANIFGTSEAAIIGCCKKQKNRKTAGGYHWAYYEE